MTSTQIVTHAENNLPLIDGKAKSQNFQKLLPTPLLDDILFESPFSLKKKLFLKRQILDENFLSTSDEYERGEANEEKKFSDY